MRPGPRDAIARAIEVNTLRQLARTIGIAEAMSAIAAMDDTKTPRELAAAGRDDHHASVVAEMVRLEREGKGRKAAGILALRNAMDARDPAEVGNLKDKYRRWRREEKRAHARLP